MPKLPAEPHIGMKADEVLKMRGRGKFDAAAPAQWIEPNKKVVWHYIDCSVVLEHDGTVYRVKEIVKNVPG